MPPEDRFVCRFAAEPPQDGAPYGRWAERLRDEFLAAVAAIDPGDEDLGEPGDPVWYPDRTWAGRAYVPVTAPTSTGLELFGYVSFAPGDADHEPTDFFTSADFTDETAERNPDWKLDLCEEVVGGWRGEGANVAAMTLVWGRPLVADGVVATGELANLAVDQCAIADGRFTLLAPDAYRNDYLEVKLFDRKGTQIASESLYDED
jgi:hypothetical protein